MTMSMQPSELATGLGTPVAPGPPRSWKNAGPTPIEPATAPPGSGWSPAWERSGVAVLQGPTQDDALTALPCGTCEVGAPFAGQGGHAAGWPDAPRFPEFPAAGHSMAALRILVRPLRVLS